jgi:glutamyl-tRNA synthetase
MTTKANNSDNLVITRFAPSPTGLMHIGNARTALFSYLFAKKYHGEFLLRIEDTDRERSKPEYVNAIQADLINLGLNWDKEIVYQSKRTTIYDKFYQQLQSKGLMYRCFCSEDKLNFMRKSQLAKGMPPKYDGTCLKLSANGVEQKLADQEQHCWRFKVPEDTSVEFNDLIKGRQHFNSNDFGDFVILRQTGAPSFMFSSAVDDALQGVTHVLRGEDHVSNTPRQILILQALGLEVPEYGHFCLLTAVNKEQEQNKVEKLSKRSGSQSISDLLSVGYLPAGLLNYLARLGHGYINQDNQLFALQQLADNFDLQHTTSNLAKHDMDHLKFWQKQAMLHIDTVQLLKLLQNNAKFNQIFINKNLDSSNNSDKLADFLTLMQENISMPEEAIAWFKALFADNLQELELSLDMQDKIKSIDQKFLTILANMSTNIEFKDLVTEFKTQEFNNKQIYPNLRMILTGSTAGPELNKIFTIMGHNRIKSRAQEIIQLINN